MADWAARWGPLPWRRVHGGGEGGVDLTACAVMLYHYLNHSCVCVAGLLICCITCVGVAQRLAGLCRLAHQVQCTALVMSWPLQHVATCMLLLAGAPHAWVHQTVWLVLASVCTILMNEEPSGCD
jgi:hypothetical protein